MSYLANKKMLQQFALKRSVSAISGALALAAAPMGAIAQDSGEASLEEVLVTGTLIRGTEVTGSQTIGISSEDIGEISAQTTNELLGAIPQVSNYFNGRPEEDPRSANVISINRPNLRNMPGFNSASGSVTLLLMDGHRVAPVGVFESSIDPDIFFASTLRSVDIVTDGGSSLYGADAVAGVINFVTKDSFDGVEIDLNGGTGDDYDTLDISLTAGTSWDDGSIMFSATHADRDGFLNGDRDWIGLGTYNETGSEFTPVLGTECLDPVRTNYVWKYFDIPGVFTGWTDSDRAPGTQYQSAGDPGCDQNAVESAVPDHERDGLFLSFQQALGDNFSFGLKSYYAKRTSSTTLYPLGGTAPAPVDVTVNPGDLDQETIDKYGLPPVVEGDYLYPAGTGFSYGVHSAYRDREQETEISTWGVAPELIISLKNSWQIRNTLYYGRSENTNVDPSVNTGVANAAVLSGDLNPLDVASADSDLIKNILDWENKTETEQELTLLRVIADGELIDLPAGAMRMALGVEYADDSVKTRSGTGTIGSLSRQSYARNSRHSKSVFAEFAIPVLDTLDLSLSARYDDYSDFGDTTNPNVGFSFTPTDWLEIYGHWGESFNAPTALDGLAVSNANYSAQTTTQTEAADVFDEWDGQGDVVVVLNGSFPGLQPQTAETWALGFEMEPLEGLVMNANYYSIDFTDILGQLGVPTPEIRQDFPEKFIWNPTPESYQAILSTLSNPEFADGVIDPDNPSADMTYFYDRRTSNFAEAELEGIDFAVSYWHDTSIGTMTYGISGNYQLKFDLVEGGEASDNLDFNPDLTLLGTLAWQLDNVRAKLTLKYTDSYTADPGAINQSKVDSFLVTNFFAGYEFQGGGFAEDLSIRFIVDNVFDEDPPEYRLEAPTLNSSGFTFGRVYKLGITKRFL